MSGMGVIDRISMRLEAAVPQNPNGKQIAAGSLMSVVLLGGAAALAAIAIKFRPPAGAVAGICCWSAFFLTGGVGLSCWTYRMWQNKRANDAQGTELNSAKKA